ncbi:MAG: hypothetical protein HZC28_09950 [Spirochaetes bacterium]|nr:hypothetical protein [Spirochaetota bacterium]
MKASLKLLLILLTTGIANGTLILHPIDPRLSEDRFLSGNVWSNAIAAKRLVYLEAVSQKMIPLYEYDECPIFIERSNEATNIIYDVYLTNSISVSNTRFSPTITSDDTAFIRQILNDGVVSQQEIMKMRVAVIRGCSINTYFISNDTLIIWNNKNSNSNVISLQLPGFVSATGNSEQFNSEESIGIGIRYGTSLGTVSLCLFPYVYTMESLQTQYLGLKNDFLWQSRIDMLFKNDVFIVNNTCIYKHADQTLTAYNVPITVTNIYSSYSISVNQILQTATNDMIANIATIGARFGYFRGYYTLISSWLRGNGTAFYYATNGAMTNAVAQTSPWGMSLSHSIRFALTDKRETLRNLNTFYLDGTVTWSEMRITDSTFTYRLFGNYRVDETLSCSINGYFKHALDRNLLLEKMAFGSSLSFPTSPNSLYVQGNDYYLAASFNYWDANSIFSASIIATRMMTMFQNRSRDYPEMRLNIMWRTLLDYFAFGIDYRINRGGEFFPIKDGWWNNFVLLLRISMPLESDFERIDIVRHRID